MAGMPSETSSQIANATNGVEPPPALVTIKGSKEGVLRQVVPEIRKLKNRYNLRWDQKSPVGYLKIMAVITKFMDQAISSNTSYNPQHYPVDPVDNQHKIPMSELLTHLVFAYKYGLPTLYYFNTFDNAGEVIFHEEITAAEPMIESEDCDSCVL